MFGLVILLSTEITAAIGSTSYRTPPSELEVTLLRTHLQPMFPRREVQLRSISVLRMSSPVPFWWRREDHVARECDCANQKLERHVAIDALFRYSMTSNSKLPCLVSSDSPAFLVLRNEIS